MKRFLWISVLAATSVATGAATNQSDVLTRTTVSPQQRLAALSALWSEAKFSFAYYPQIADNWDRLYESFIPRVQGAPNDYEYYQELMRFYAHLHDGHSGVFWPPEFNEALGYPPIEIRKVEGLAAVFRILRETEELSRNHIRPGQVILEIDGRPSSELVNHWRQLKTGSTEQATDRLTYFRILTGRRNSEVKLLLQERDGTQRSVRLIRSEKYFNDTNLEPRHLFASRAPERGVGYFQANQMSAGVADAFRSYIETTADLRGLILDLRYNGGGSDLVSSDMVSRLTDHELKGHISEVTAYRADRRVFRQAQEVIRTQDTIAPATGKRFTGPLVVLIGEQTHSAAEGGFVSVIRGRPRTQLIGEPTAGSTGQPLGFRLPGGGLGVVCSRRGLTPSGERFVGIGFQPDVRLALTLDDLYAGRDSVFEKAIEIVAKVLEQHDAARWRARIPRESGAAI